MRISSLLFLCAFGLLVSGCFPPGKITPGGNTGKPNTGQGNPSGGGSNPNTNGGKPDTSGSTDPKPNTGGSSNPTTGGGKPNTGGGTDPNIGGGGKPTTGSGKASYDVALLLPFYSDRFSDTTTVLYSKSGFAMEYYGGTLLALEQLKSENITLNLQVFDTKKGTFSSVINRSDVRDADLVIGPAEKDNIPIANQFSLTSGKTVVSMYYPSGDLDTPNPNFVQINPSLAAHCQGIIEDVMKKYPGANITIVSRSKDGESDRFKLLQDAYATNQGSTSAHLAEMIVTDETATLASTDFSSRITKGLTNVIIIPSWNETFCQAALRKLESQRKGAKVVVYGMPQWMDFNNISPELFTSLSVHVSTAQYTAANDTEMRDFKRTFFERYGKAPTEDAVLGYDVTVYTGRMMKKYGPNFSSRADMEHYHGLARQIRLTPVGSPGQPNERRGASKYENKEVFILRFKDYTFQE